MCKCLKDNCIFEKTEGSLRNGHGCPVCDNKKVVKGINDIGTTNPELVCFFVNENDVYTHTIGSNDIVSVKCKHCENIKNMTVFELNRRNGFVCDNCSDNISYPNKFAHELFRQLSNQYKEYIKEYSPKWAERYRYDNYIELLDGKKIIVEMDGGFHYNKYEKFNSQNDEKKELLALNHNIPVIHIDCNYSNTKNRFEYVKANIIKALNKYFDLSNIDWALCDKAGISNMMENVIEYFNNNNNCTIKDISRYFGISLSTTYEYIQVGSRLGMCNYIKDDSNRNKQKSLAVSISDINGNLIGVYKSIQRLIKEFPEMNFNYSSIKYNIRKNKPYKGYIFKYSTQIYN